MIDDPLGRIDYDEYGAGPAIVLVPGSCSTGVAWRPVMGALNGRFRCVTTSLLGYGETAERRTAQDTSVAHETEIVEAVARKAGGAVHLVGHSFGGIVALTVALRNKVTVKSLTILEAPAADVLREYGEMQHYAAFRAMTDRYFAAFAAGETDAIAIMIDFYGGAGTYASWPERVRAYAVQTTAVNIRDWASAYDFPLWRTALTAITIPTLVAWGEASHPAAQRANALLAQSIDGAHTAVIGGAAHFMIATHADAVASLIADHTLEADGAMISTAG